MYVVSSNQCVGYIIQTTMLVHGQLVSVSCNTEPQSWYKAAIVQKLFSFCLLAPPALSIGISV